MFENMKEIESFFSSRMSAGIKPGLARMKKMLAYVGHPEKKIDFIHVTGTNGKGSTIQFIKQGLLANNIDVGVFTSPSLNGLLGHITINNQVISGEDFITHVNKLMPKIKEMDKNNESPTEFEIITTVAFMHFSQNVSLALIEAGMGGRGDTTNCIFPLLSIITNVSIDHTNFLGTTLEAITNEKAGIIKEKIPVIIGSKNPKVSSILREQAKLKRAPFLRLGEQFRIDHVRDQDLLTYDLYIKDKKYELSLEAGGIFQVQNSALALVALLELKKLGFPINLRRAITAFAQLRIPGRFETIQTNPKIIVDGAHNVSAVKAFIETINHRLPKNHKKLIFSAFKDKQIPAMLLELSSVFDDIILTSFDHPRAASLKDLNTISETLGLRAKTLPLEAILPKILKEQNEKTYVFTGSIHFINIIQRYFN